MSSGEHESRGREDRTVYLYAAERAIFVHGRDWGPQGFWDRRMSMSPLGMSYFTLSFKVRLCRGNH